MEFNDTNNLEDRLKEWKLLKKEKGPQIPLFDVEFQFLENPRNQALLKALVLHARDTVNVVAFSDREELLLVEQYRFGIGEHLLELPAGFIDDGESALQAAQRELSEETGYISSHWQYIGYSYINPSYVTNRCFHFLCSKAQCLKKIEPDQTEDIRLVKIPKDNINHFLKEGGLKDAIGKATIGAALELANYSFIKPA